MEFLTVIVDPRKLTGYLLAEDHPEGGAKAHFFIGCGFTPAEAQRLAEALRLLAETGDPDTLPGPFGVKIRVDGPLGCPDGRSRRRRSVWIVEGVDTPARFVTAYPLEAPHGAR